jgi:hypothetical protein
MRKTWCAACVAGLVFCAVGRLWSGEDEAALRKLIARAIEAQGGEANLAKWSAVHYKGTGKFYGIGGEGLPVTIEATLQGANQQRFVVELKVADMGVKLVKVVNGDKGWSKLNKDKTQAMTKEVLAEEREQMYGAWVATLLPLKGKGFKLAPLGEVKVDGHEAVGIRVSHAGHRDVRLFFDKKNHLLVKSEMTIKNVEDGSNKEMIQEILYSDYKDVAGAKQAMKLSAKRDGKRYVEGEISEAQPKGKLDDSEFAAKLTSSRSAAALSSPRPRGRRPAHPPGRRNSRPPSA